MVNWDQAKVMADLEFGGDLPDGLDHFENQQSSGTFLGHAVYKDTQS
jgi:hypothetical protein